MKRNWRVDTLRGFFLVLMTLAHLPPHPLQRFTGYMFGFASSPDGFVFLSGLVSAWVYLGVRAKKGSKGMEQKSVRRFRDIYLTHVALLLASIVECVFVDRGSFRGSHPLGALIAGSLLVYQPHTSDILPMYCIFLLFLPVILENFMRGRARGVGLVSLLLWLVAQRGIGDASYVVPYIDLGAFNILAWQAYFVGGLYLGYRGVVAETPVLRRSRVLLAACAIGSVSLFLLRHSGIVDGIALIRFHLSPDHNPLRFLDAICLGYIIWMVPSRLDLKLMHSRFLGFLNYLGRHSLQVFAWSLSITNFLSYFEVYTWDKFSGTARGLLAFLIVASLGIPAVVHEQYRERQRRQTRRMEYAASTVS